MVNRKVLLGMNNLRGVSTVHRRKDFTELTG